MGGNPSSQGYYLCNRPLSYGQMLLIADGIESIDNIQADAKVKIYEALKKITGFHASNYIYEKRNKSNDDIGDEEDSLFFGIATGVEERLHVINKALETVKMLTISNFMFGRPMYQCLLTYIEGNEKLEIGKLQDDQMYRDPVAIAPYRLFRNCRDEICLAFYMEWKGKIYPGYFPVNEPHQIALVDKPKSLLGVKDEDALFPTDMINSTTAKEYQVDNSLGNLKFVYAPEKDHKQLTWHAIERTFEEIKEIDKKEILGKTYISYKASHKYKNRKR